MSEAPELFEIDAGYFINLDDRDEVTYYLSKSKKALELFGEQLSLAYYVYDGENINIESLLKHHEKLEECRDFMMRWAVERIESEMGEDRSSLKNDDDHSTSKE